jgi:hypothetical protein
MSSYIMPTKATSSSPYLFINVKGPDKEEEMSHVTPSVTGLIACLQR